MNCNQFENSWSRRDLLRNSACGFGQLALAGMAGTAGAGIPSIKGQPGEGTPHFPPRAKRIIFLFMWGGPSHVDLFDPKPRLNSEDGQELAGKAVGVPREKLGKLLGTPFRFRKHGQSGVVISELMPRLAHHADKLCVIRSMHTNGSAHGEALLRLHTGAANLVRPSVGAWVSYGLGQANDNLPAFVTISPPRGHGGVQNYGNAFLPDIHQGTAIGSAEIPIAKAQIANLVNRQLSRNAQRKQLDLIQSFNRQHLSRTQQDKRIEGLIEQLIAC